jgi:single-strand DNA-binding protein
MSVSNINHVVLTGRLTSDPDLRALPSGASVCHLRIAVNGRRRDPDTREWGEKPNFFDVVVFGAPAENVARYMHTGRAVAIDGRLDWREWQTRDGRNAQAVSVVAHTVQFLGSPSASGDGPADGGGAGGALHGIAGDEEESLNVEDQDAIALAAAEG